jgi:nucleoside-diphosphate-sugar epimerase
MRVFLTGSGGRLARALLPRLLEDARIQRVVGIDLRPCDRTHPKLEQHLRDIRDPDIGALMHGCDALIHAAFVVVGSHLGWNRRRRNWVRSVNLKGSQNVFEQAASGGIANLVHLSSVAVYSGLRDTGRPIDEHRDLAPLSGFPYAEDKVAVERWLDGFETRHPGLRLVRLRPHVILGAQAQPLLRQMLSQPFCPRRRGVSAKTQCVWEEDVVGAIELALFSPARGPFNLATAPALSLCDMIRFRGMRPIPVPVWSIGLVHRLIWWITTRAGDPGWTRGLGKALVVDARRAADVLGWEPAYSVYDCLRSLSDRRPPDGATPPRSD